jgi:hypothetical protein
VKGKVKSTVGSEEFIMGPGDVCRHPKGVLHGLEAIEDSVVVEIKSPAPEIGAFLAIRKGGLRLIGLTVPPSLFGRADELIE